MGPGPRGRGANFFVSQSRGPPPLKYQLMARHRYLTLFRILFGKHASLWGFTQHFSRILFGFTHRRHYRDVDIVLWIGIKFNRLYNLIDFISPVPTAVDVYDVDYPAVGAFGVLLTVLPHYTSTKGVSESAYHCIMGFDFRLPGDCNEVQVTI